MDKNIDPAKFVAIKNVEKVLSESEEGKDCLNHYVDGRVVGLNPGPIPCIVNKTHASVDTITLADGPYTGTQFTIDHHNVIEISDGDLGKACEGLF